MLKTAYEDYDQLSEITNVEQQSLYHPRSPKLDVEKITKTKQVTWQTLRYVAKFSLHQNNSDCQKFFTI